MTGLRRKPQPPCACGCEDLARRLAEYEALSDAIVRAIVALRPRAAHHSVEQGLTGWGVQPPDAALLAAVYRAAPAARTNGG